MYADIEDTNQIFYNIFQWILPLIYGRFAIEREETLKKLKNELILNLNKLQYLKHFCHINKKLIFFRVSSLSIAKRPYNKKNMWVLCNKKGENSKKN